MECHAKIGPDGPIVAEKFANFLKVIRPDQFWQPKLVPFANFGSPVKFKFETISRGTKPLEISYACTTNAQKSREITTEITGNQKIRLHVRNQFIFKFVLKYM